jgi:hypothetical protein
VAGGHVREYVGIFRVFYFLEIFRFFIFLNMFRVFKCPGMSDLVLVSK